MNHLPANPCRICLFGALLALSAAAASAPGAPIDPSVLEELGHEDYEVREAATRRLIRDRQVTLSALESLYAVASMDEQRHRLLRAARHHFVRQAIEKLGVPQRQGALGIRLQGVAPNTVPGIAEPSVRVIMTLPGFPAHEMLEADDFIVAINGQPLTPTINPQAITREFIGMVVRARPGQVIEVTIYRDGQLRQQRVELASHEALSTFYVGSPHTLRQPHRGAWLEQRARFAELGPEIEPWPIDLAPLEDGAAARDVLTDPAFIRRLDDDGRAQLEEFLELKQRLLERVADQPAVRERTEEHLRRIEQRLMQQLLEGGAG